MNRSVTGWFHHLSIGQKLLISFGLILSLLALSLTALLFYLARINSYVDRHKRITVPAIVTAANMRREAYDLKLALHLSNSRDVTSARTAPLDGHAAAITGAPHGAATRPETRPMMSTPVTLPPTPAVVARARSRANVARDD